MDTKKIQLKGHKKSKGGLNTTQTILTAAGAAAVGAGAAAAASMFTPHEEEPVVEPVPNGEQESVTEENTQNAEAQTTHETPEQSVENITEPTPFGWDDNQPEPAPQPEPTPEPNPNVIAEQIIRESRVDVNDIDVPNVIAVDGFATAYNEYGDEVQVAVVHTPDGGQFLLADTNGDGIFSDVYDMGGNFVAMAEANLVYSDLETMLDTTGGYLALNEHDWMTEGDDPTQDIIDTETGQNVDLAQVDVREAVSSNDSEMDELLASLIDDDDDGILVNGSGGRGIEEPEEEEEVVGLANDEDEDEPKDEPDEEDEYPDDYDE